jgi:hypothetical protein
VDVLSGSRPKLHFSPLTGKARLDTRSCRIACELSSSNPSPKISPPPESFSELKQRIALIRELPFKREVSLANESPQATSEGILSDEYGTQSLVHISRAYDSDFFVNPQISLQLWRTM